MADAVCRLGMNARNIGQIIMRNRRGIALVMQGDRRDGSGSRLMIHLFLLVDTEMDGGEGPSDTHATVEIAVDGSLV